MIRRVLAFGTWDEGLGYPRTSSLFEALRGRGVEVETLRADAPWRGKKSEVVRSPSRWLGYAFRTARSRRRLREAFAASIAECRPDAVLVPYPGHQAVRWVRSWFDGPIVLDLFLSAYGTIVEDRRLFAEGSLAARLFRRVDRLACRAADLVLVDTPLHADYVRELAAPECPDVDWVPVCVPDDRPPREYPRWDRAEPLRVLSFGTGVPLHGLRTLLHAVAGAGERVRLTLVGGSPEDRLLAMEMLAGRLDLRAEFVPPSELSDLIDGSHLVAGVFGTSRKAGMVVPYKIVHALARARAVLTADTAAVRQLLEPDEDCLTVPPGDSSALGRQLIRIADDPSALASIGSRARRRFERSFSPEAATGRLAEVLERRLGSLPGGAAAPVHPAGAAAVMEEEHVTP